MALNVEQQTIIKAGLDASAYKTGADQVVAANAKISASGDDVVQAQTKTTRTLVDGGAAYEKLVRSLDSAASAAAGFARAQDIITRAVQNGRATQDQANATLILAYQRYGQLTQSATQAAAAMQRAAEVQGRVNGVTGVSRGQAVDMDAGNRAAEVAAYWAQLDRLKASYNPLFAAAQAYDAQLLKINKDEATGAIIAAEATAARTAATASYDAAIAKNKAYADAINGTAKAQTDAAKGQQLANNFAGSAGRGLPSTYASGSPLDAAGTAARGADVAAGFDAFNAKRAQYDQLFAASKRYEQALEDIDELEKQGLNPAVAQGMRDRQAALMTPPPPPKPPLEDLDALRARYDAVFAASKRYESTLEDIARLEAAGLSPARADALRDTAAQAMAPPAVKAEDLSQLREQYDAVYAASKRYEAALEDIAKLEAAGLSPARANALRDQAAQANLASKSNPAADNAAAMAAEGAEIDRLKTKYNSIYAISKQYEAELNEINKALKLGAITQMQAEDATTKAGKAMQEAGDKAAKGGKSLDDAKLYTAGFTRELIVLTHEFVTGNFTRIPGSLLVLGERMGSLHLIAEAAKEFLVTPFGLMAAAATIGVAALVAVGVSSEMTARRMIAMQNALRATRDDYVAAAKAADDAAKIIARTTPVSTADARTATETFQATPAFRGTVGDMVELTRTAENMALVMGGTVPENAAKLAAAMGDPGKATTELVGKLSGFTAQLARQVTDMANAGKTADAWALYLDKVRAATDGATRNVTPLQEAIHHLSEAFAAGGQNTRSLADALGSFVTGAAAGVINSLTSIVDLVHAAQAAADKFGRDHPDVQMPSFMDALKIAVSPATAAYSTVSGLFGPKTATDPGGFPVLGPEVNHLVQGRQVSEQAVGAFQVLPSTAAGMGLDQQAISTISGNVQAGVGDLFQKFLQAGGQVHPAAGTDQSAAINEALRRYGGYSSVDAASGYIGKVRNADPSSVDPAVQSAINARLGSLGLPSQLEDIIRRLPAVEASGRQYETSGVHPSMQPADAAAMAAGRAPQDRSGFYPTNGVRTDPQATINKADADYQAAGTVDRQQALNLQAQDRQEAAIAELNKRMDAAKASGDVGAQTSTQESLDKAQITLTHLKGAYNDILTAQEASARAAQDALNPLTAEVGAARDLATIREKYAQMARSSGVLQDAQMAAELTAKQRELTQAFQDGIVVIARQTVANDNLNPILELGGQAAEFAANRQKALEDVRKTAVVGSAEYTRQVNVETAALNANTVSKHDNQAASDIAGYANENTQISAQIRLLVSSTDQRNREIAVLQERQKLGLTVGQQASAEEQKALDAAAATASAKTQLETYTNALTETASTISSAFDTIGNSITQSLFNNGGAAVNWRNVMLSVSQQVLQAFLKLAVLNPLLNEVFGGNRGTLTGLLDASNAVTAGSTTSSGDNSGGLLGSLVGLGLKAFGLGGGGTGGSGASAGGNYVLSAAHTGMLVGYEAPPMMKTVSAASLNTAPRYHTGLNSDEFVTILQRGERVLTAKQDRAVSGVLQGVGNAANANPPPMVNINVQTPDADSFRRSSAQIYRKATTALSVAQRRNG